MTDPIFLWPPNPDPDPESWKCALPDEGISFDLEDNDYGNLWITEYKNSYHGTCIAKLLVKAKIFETKFKEREYNEAYGVIQVILNSPNLDWNSESIDTWKFACNRIITSLKEKGWFEVEAEECEVNGEHHYFRRKK